MAQRQHAQTGADGVVPVAARQVQVGVSGLQALHQRSDGGLQFEFVDRALATLEEHGGHQRHRQHRNQSADLAHQVVAERCHFGLALFARQVVEVDAARRRPRAHRHGRAEVDAGIAKAVPAAAQQQPKLIADEAQRAPQRTPAAGLRGRGIASQQLRAVFEHAVVVEAERHEHQVALAMRVKAAQHVVEHAKARRTERAVARQPALGVHRLRHAGLGGHGDVAFEHAPVQIVFRIAAHEVRAHRTDQVAQAPRPRPLTDGVGQRGAFGGEVRGDDVVHVAAVVHDEHHRGLLGDRVQPGVVGVADAHAVEETRQCLASPVADAEVHVGVERRHDLACVALHLIECHFTRHAARVGKRLRRLLHLVVEDQAVDQGLPAHLLERADADLQPPADVVEHAVGAALDEPARARQQQAVEQRPQGQQPSHHNQPQRQRDGAASHAPPSAL